MARNVCFINGAFVFFSRDSDPTVPRPLASANANFWWEKRGADDISTMFSFKQWRQPVPKDVSRVDERTYFFLEDVDFDFHFGHTFLDGLLGAFRAFELFAIDKIDGAQLKIGSADSIACWV